MKNIKSRIISSLLCSVMLLSVLASCADNEEEKKLVDPNQTSENESNAPTFVEEDFGEEKFTILSAQDEATDFIDHYIDNEEMTGEPINDAVIDRNRAVEEKYNVVVERKSEGLGYATQAAKSGTVDFEIVYDWGIRIVPSAMEGYYYDLHQVPYVDLEQSYWAPSTHEDLTIADKMLIFTCDVSMNRIGWAYFQFFNKRIIEDLNYDLPYDLVNQNKWTYDTFLSMIVGAENDVNGDTLWTTDDQYGHLSNSQSILDSFVSWSGITGTTKNEDGTYTLSMYNDKLMLIYSTYVDKLSNSNAFADNHDINWTEGVDISGFPSGFKASRMLSFGSGKTLFATFSMDITQELTGMEDDYGVVPNPKYEESQADYHHYIDVCAPMFTIIKQADMDKVGIIMEYMAYESEQRLLPAFYEQTIKTKNMTDIEGRDEKMLDIIRDSCRYSWTNLYQQGIKNAEGDGWDPCGTIISEMLAAGNFASVYKRYQAAAEKSLSDIYDLILDMDVNK